MGRKMGIDLSMSMSIGSGLASGGGASRTYAKWNTSDKGANVDLSNGNLTMNNPTGAWLSVRANQALSGKQYWEVLVVGSDQFIIGVMDSNGTVDNFVGASFNGVGGYLSTGGVLIAGFTTGTVKSISSFPTRFMIATDIQNKKGWIGSGGTWASGANPETGANPTFTWSDNWTVYPAASAYSSNPGETATANFGATAFTHTVPAGFNSGVYS
jgi:hypothetical protein